VVFDGVDPLRIPRIQAVDKDLAYWLAHFEKNPADRFVSDGDPQTLTIRPGTRDKLKLSLPKGLKVTER
jgi:hypothetical protein